VLLLLHPGREMEHDLNVRLTHMGMDLINTSISSLQTV
jgi:hypothetical protein